MAKIEYRAFTTELMEQVTRIYTDNGWTEYLTDPGRLKRAFENSLFLLGAFREGELLGFIRCVGDGETVLYVQDLIVSPLWQRHGIGRELLRRVSERCPDVRQFLLITDRDDPVSNAFYASVGMVADCHGYPVTAYFRDSHQGIG